jgi:hypothetical protein
VGVLVGGTVVLSLVTTRVEVAVGTGVWVGHRVAVAVGGRGVAVGAGVAVQDAATRVMACTVLVWAAACRSLCAGSQSVRAATKARTPNRTNPAIATAI